MTILERPAAPPSMALWTADDVDGFPSEMAAALPPPAPGIKRLLGRTLAAVGLLALVFGFFQIGIGTISERREQRALRGAFRDLIASGAPLGAGTDGKAHVIEAGTPIALLQIPSLGVNKIVLEGTTAGELKRGPGHLRTSVVPGQYGHAIIAGRRTTYGSPFRRLNLLRAGDEIVTTTPYGRFVYRVRTTTFVGPRKALNVEESTSGLLTLLTSDPAYTPRGALAVDAELVGEPSTFADPPRVSGQAGGIDFTGDGGALLVVALLGMLVFGAVAGAQILYQRWHRWPTYLITTPVIAALMVAWMDGLISMLPSTL